MTAKWQWNLTVNLPSFLWCQSITNLKSIWPQRSVFQSSKCWGQIDFLSSNAFSCQMTLHFYDWKTPEAEVKGQFISQWVRTRFERCRSLSSQSLEIRTQTFKIGEFFRQWLRFLNYFIFRGMMSFLELNDVVLLLQKWAQNEQVNTCSFYFHFPRNAMRYGQIHLLPL